MSSFARAQHTASAAGQLTRAGGANTARRRHPTAKQDSKASRRGRHEGGVEPLALSCSTDLKSAPRTDEDHHGLLLAPSCCTSGMALERGSEAAERREIGWRSISARRRGNERSISRSKIVGKGLIPQRPQDCYLVHVVCETVRTHCPRSHPPEDTSPQGPSPTARTRVEQRER